MRFGLLGSLEVVDDDGASVDIGGGQARTVLAVLLAAEGRLVPAESIVDVLWGDEPPASANGTLQSYVSRLRRTLEPDRAAGAPAEVLRWEPPGYRVTVGAGAVDFRRFEALAEQGRQLLASGEHDAARDALVEAEGLWRGPALLEFADLEFAAGLAGRLEERRLAALEDRVEADLALGHHATVAAELGELVAANPLREALWAQYALALYRSGRQSEALRAIDRARRTLRDELGIEPGRGLHELESRILDHDVTLEPDPVLTAATTAGPLPAKGAATPVRGVRDEVRLVGRQAELAQLTGLFDALAAGSRMAIVEGEPGIGKTTLVEALGDEARHRGAAVVWGRCHEGEAAPAFWPWLAALRALVADRPEVTEWAPAAFSDLLDPGAGSGAVSLGPFQLFEAVAGTLGHLAADAPVVVMLDDLQWADEGSLELLSFLAGRLDDEAILIVGTVRELELGRNDAVVEALAAVTRRPGSPRLRLRGLAADETSVLLGRATGRDVPAEVAASIHHRAEGNPFYATELARLLADDTGAYDLVGDPGAVLAGAEVPAGVRDVVRRRLSRLPAETVELLQVGAVIGREFELGLLTRASGHAVGDALDELEPALVHRLLVPVVDQAATFKFVHALVREVLVEDVSPLRRARTHLHVADAISPEGDDVLDDEAEIVAEHLWAAAPLGVGARAAGALERAAEVAVRRVAYATAEEMLDRALQIRRAGGPGREAAEAELRAVSRLAAVQRARYGYARAEALFERGRELAQRIGREDVYVELLWAEWAGADTACDFDRARPIAAQFREMAERDDDPALSILGHGVWGIQCWHDGRIAESAEWLDRACALAEDPAGPHLALAVGAEHQLLVTAFVVHVHDLVGDEPDASAKFDALIRAQGDPHSVAMISDFGCAGALARGDFARAQRFGRRGLEADPDLAFTFWGSGLLMYEGLARMNLGDAEGEASFRSGLETYLASGLRTAMGCYLANYAGGLLRLGRLSDARTAVDDAHQERLTYDERWTEPVTLSVEADVARAEGADDAQVTALLVRAREVARAQGSLALAARAEATAARLDITLP